MLPATLARPARCVLVVLLLVCRDIYIYIYIGAPIYIHIGAWCFRRCAVHSCRSVRAPLDTHPRCVCVCVCVRARTRTRARLSEREGGREGGQKYSPAAYNFSCSAFFDDYSLFVLCDDYSLFVDRTLTGQYVRLPLVWPS
jgi:hypothetical protein